MTMSRGEEAARTSKESSSRVRKGQPYVARRGRGRPPKGVQVFSESSAAYKLLESASPDDYISPNQAGRLLGVTGEAVKQWIYHRRLPATKLPNGYWKVKVADFRAFVKSRTDARRRRILLADTDADSVGLVQKILDEQEHKCILAHNALDALLKAADSYPALFIINLSCSGIDGWKLAQKIRTTRNIKNVPILFISSKAETEEDVDRALEVGAQGFLRQPLGKDLLLKEINRVLGAML